MALRRHGVGAFLTRTAVLLVLPVVWACLVAWYLVVYGLGRVSRLLR